MAEESATINDLPEEILIKIFNHLPGADLKNIRMVNKKWAVINNCIKLRKKLVLIVKNQTLSEFQSFALTMMKSNDLYQHLRFDHVRFHNSDLLLSLWIKLGPMLQTLEIYTGDYEFDYNFFLLIERSVNLESLTLGNDCHVNLDILNKLPKLEQLVFQVGCTSRTMLPSVTKQYLNLKSLTIIDTNNFIDATLTDAVTKIFPNLTTLYLKLVTRAGLQNVFLKCKNLKTLKVTIQPVDNEDDDISVRNMSKLVNLESLHMVPHVGILNDKCLIEEFAFTKLTDLYLDGGRNVTDVGIIAVVTNCPKLRKVCLRRFHKLTGVSVEHCVKKLKDLVSLDLRAAEARMITLNCLREFTREEKRKVFLNPCNRARGRPVRQHVR